MTRKNYIAVAAQFRTRLDSFTRTKPRNEGESIRYVALCEMAEAMADVFAADNSRFDRSRFLTACGITE